MKWFHLRQIGIFGTPKCPVLLSDESIKLEMCFIGESNANNIKAVIMNHIEHPVRKVKPLSQSWCRYTPMIMNFVGKHVWVTSQYCMRVRKLQTSLCYNSADGFPGLMLNICRNCGEIFRCNNCWPVWQHARQDHLPRYLPVQNWQRACE